MMLFFAGGALGIMEAAQKLFHPEHSVENTWLVMAILLFGLMVESASLHVAFKEIKELNRDRLPLYRFLRESRHSEILIIFAEDSCAVVGLLIALAGTLLSHFTGNPFYDALSGVLIGVLLCTAALFLAREFYSLLIGESVTEKDLTRIKTSFNRPEISQLINIKNGIYVRLSRPTTFTFILRRINTEKITREALIPQPLQSVYHIAVDVH